mmetsp:Transcript_17944/g.18706  ORF Transcript_17944/g.18706 Transcript_17944/m.18706 type:complete len:186 (-) Transcript_17944:9-566(-)
MQWVYHKALERADNYGITGVTYFLTIGVVKNVIPAVASTNAIISACCVNEVFKLLTFTAQTMNTYYMYVGNDGVYSSTFEYNLNPTCLVCSQPAPTSITVSESSTTLSDFITILSNDANLQIKTPIITLCNRPLTLYASTPAQLEQATRENLSKLMSNLIENKELLFVTDKNLRHGVTIQVIFDV